MKEKQIERKRLETRQEAKQLHLEKDLAIARAELHAIKEEERAITFKKENLASLSGVHYLTSSTPLLL